MIHPRCKDLIVGAQREYVYKQLRIRGGERFSDSPDKLNPFSHVCDALQYYLIGHGVGAAMLHGGTAPYIDQERFME